MATLADVERIVTALPEVVVGERYGRTAWSVDGKVFAWERPFSKADLKRFGEATPPDGPIVAVSCADLTDKEAILAQGTPGLFTISHFDGFAAVLIEVRAVRMRALREVLIDGWLTCAPAPLAADYVAAAKRRPRARSSTE